MSLTTLQDDVSQQLKFADQRRLLSRVALSISLILIIYLSIVLVIMPVLTIGKVIAAVAAILIGSLAWICHHEKLYTASAAMIVAITIIGGFVASLSNGGADGFVAPIMISAPIMAAVFIGARATLIAAVGVVLAIASLLYLEHAGFVTEAPYSAATLDIAAVVMLSASTGICATGVGYFAAAMQTQIKSLRASRQRLMQLSEQLDHAAHHDALTGLSNRTGLQRHLECLFGDASAKDSVICLIHVDLDKFKAINDTYGHPVGDAVLRKAAEIMKDHFRAEDFVSRVGGDEFVIVPSQSLQAVQAVQERCDRLIERLRAPIIVDGIECRIGASIGFVVAERRDCSIDGLMINADLALYESKRDGGVRAHQFTATLREKLHAYRAFSEKVEEALFGDRVCCVLQPQVCLQTGVVTGVEGLGRIRGEGGELLMPGDILPILSEMGRLRDFDFKVMQRSLDALIRLRAAGLNVPHVSINASAESLRSPDYVSDLIAELERRQLRPEDIVVEILESTLIESMDDAAAKSITGLLKAGVTAMMDDFGSGHATISNLLKLDLDGLKIDRSLISNLDDNRVLQVVKAVLDLSHNLGLSVIAEGVETPQQFATLRGMGCQTVQGFGICKPIEVDAFETWLRDYGTSGVGELQGQLRRLS